MPHALRDVRDPAMPGGLSPRPPVGRAALLGLGVVSLVFEVTAAFLALQALATPGVILTAPSATFTAATPIGLLLGGVAAVASARECRDRRHHGPRRPPAEPRPARGMVMGVGTCATLGNRARVEAREPVRVKGKREPVPVYVLTDLQPV